MKSKQTQKTKGEKVMSKKENFMTDSQGRQVPAELVKDIDKLRDQTVRRIAG